jgi:cytidylate kinase
LLQSQSYWVDNQKCTYEFDITEIDKFEKFISERYDIDFKVDRINKSHPIKNNIIKDDKLKKWVFDNFEKRFISRNTLI